MSPSQRRHYLIREVQTLERELAARKTCDRPLPKSVRLAYQHTIAEHYRALHAL